MAWVEAHKDQIEVFYLPAYSPEMNPVEYLNNDMKGAVNEAGLPDDGGTLAHTNRGIHGQIGQRTETCNQLLPTSLGAIRRPC